MYIHLYLDPPNPMYFHLHLDIPQNPLYTIKSLDISWIQCKSGYTWISHEHYLYPPIPGYLLNTIYINQYLDVPWTPCIPTYLWISPESNVYPHIPGYPLNPMYIHNHLCIDISWTQCIYISIYTWISPEPNVYPYPPIPGYLLKSLDSWEAWWLQLPRYTCNINQVY